MTVQPSPTKQSVIDVLRELLADLVRFAKAEIKLVMAEGKEAGRRAITAIILFAGAGLFALLLLIFLLGAAAEAIGGWLNHQWLGWLIMAAVFLVVAAVLGLVGFRKLKGAINEAKQVKSTVTEDLEWVRNLPKRNANGT